MTNVAKISTATMIFVLFSNFASASTFVADFSGPTLDPNMSIQNSDPAITATVGGGSLTFSEPSGTSTPGGAGVYPNFAVNGDFTTTLVIDYSGVTNPNSSNFTTTAALSIDFGSVYDVNSVHMNAASQSPTDNVVFGDFVQGSVAGPFNNESFSSPVEFSVTRVGDTVTQYYGSVGGPLSMLYSVTDPNFTEPAHFYFGLNDFGGSDLAQSVTFQSFTINSATPLPGTLPLFASGLGALGLLGWRKKKKAEAAASLQEDC